MFKPHLKFIFKLYKHRYYRYQRSIWTKLPPSIIYILKENAFSFIRLQAIAISERNTASWVFWILTIQGFWLVVAQSCSIFKVRSLQHTPSIYFELYFHPHVKYLARLSAPCAKPPLLSPLEAPAALRQPSSIKPPKLHIPFFLSSQHFINSESTISLPTHFLPNAKFILTSVRPVAFPAGNKASLAQTTERYLAMISLWYLSFPQLRADTPA